MPQLHDRDFYAARAAQARARAEASSDPEIAAIHHRTADSYSELVDLIDRPAPPRPLATLSALDEPQLQSSESVR